MAKRQWSTYDWRQATKGKRVYTEQEQAVLRGLEGRNPPLLSGGGSPPIPPNNRQYTYAEPPERPKPVFTVREAPKKQPNLYAITQGLATGRSMYHKMNNEEPFDTTIKVTKNNLPSVQGALESAVANDYLAEVTITYPSLAEDEQAQIVALKQNKLRPIRLHSVISSNVRRIGMDSIDDTVYVQFKRMGNEVYYYQGGGVDLYTNLIQAPSHGHAIWEWIRWIGDPYPYGVTASPLEPDAIFVYN